MQTEQIHFPFTAGTRTASRTRKGLRKLTANHTATPWVSFFFNPLFLSFPSTQFEFSFWP